MLFQDIYTDRYIVQVTIKERNCRYLFTHEDPFLNFVTLLFRIREARKSSLVHRLNIARNSKLMMWLDVRHFKF